MTTVKDAEKVFNINGSTMKNMPVYVVYTVDIYLAVKD